jgi:hypothetical protein
MPDRAPVASVVPLHQLQPEPATLELAAMLHDLAQSGSIDGIAVVIRHRDRRVGWYWAGYSDCATVGGLHRLANAIMRQMDAQCPE